MNNHILKIIDLLYDECISAGGDGDAVWYSRFYGMDTILPLVREYNSKLKFPFEIQIVDEKTIHFGRNEEWIIITTDEFVYLQTPTWVQFVLKN